MNYSRVRHLTLQKLKAAHSAKGIFPTSVPPCVTIFSFGTVNYEAVSKTKSAPKQQTRDLPL